MATVVSASGCGKAPSDDQCKRLLDHIVDLELTKAGATPAEGSAGVKAGVDQLRAKVTEVRAPEFMEACLAKTSRARVECGIAATTVECQENQKDCGSLADCDAK
jgi:hypothetical protein